MHSHGESIKDKGGDAASISEKAVTASMEQEDGVFDFGGDTTLPPPPVLSLEQEKALYRKIDLRLMPILSLMYLCSFLDRGKTINDVDCSAAVFSDNTPYRKYRYDSTWHLLRSFI